MSDEDQHVVVILDNLTRLDSDWSWPRTNIGFSKERWKQYRTIFHKLDIEGVSRPEPYPSAVLIIVYASGGAVASVEKGLVYSQSPLTPIVKSLDVYPPTDRAGHSIAFKPLENSWYMYRDQE